jgi:hypothetical protein
MWVYSYEVICGKNTDLSDSHIPIHCPYFSCLTLYIRKILNLLLNLPIVFHVWIETNSKFVFRTGVLTPFSFCLNVLTCLYPQLLGSKHIFCLGFSCFEGMISESKSGLILYFRVFIFWRESMPSMQNPQTIIFMRHHFYKTNTGILCGREAFQ